MKKINTLPIILVIIIVFPLILSGCSSEEPSRMYLNPPGWGWAKPVLTNASSRVEINLDEDGNLYLASGTRTGDVFSLKVFSYDRDFNLLWEKTLESEGKRIGDVKLAVENGGVWVYWIENKMLYHAQLDTGGTVITSSQILSAPDQVISYLEVGKSPNGTITVWYSGDRTNPGMYRFSADRSGQPHEVIDEGGIRPEFIYDDAGNLHASWLNYPFGYETGELYYAQLPAGSSESPQPVVAATFQTNNEVDVRGPWLGLDSSNAYLFWTVAYITGLKAGEIETYYAAANIDTLVVSSTNRLQVPSLGDLSYQAVDPSALSMGEAVELDPRYSFSDVEDIAVLPAQLDELVITYHVDVEGRWNQYNKEIGTILFVNGQPEYYQIVSRSQALSSSPTMFSDVDGNVYLTWLENEGESGKWAYLASTATDLQASIGEPSFEDMSPMIYETLFGMSFGLLLSPLFAAMWMIIPLLTLWLLNKYVFKNGESASKLRTGLTLAVLLFEFWMLKYKMLVGIDTYVPFSLWIPFLTDSLSMFLKLGTPPIILIASFVVAWFFTLKKDPEGLLSFCLVYFGIDAAMTLSIYGVLFYEIG